jgi:hypothetical protein
MEMPDCTRARVSESNGSTKLHTPITEVPTLPKDARQHSVEPPSVLFLCDFVQGSEVEPLEEFGRCALFPALRSRPRMSFRAFTASLDGGSITFPPACLRGSPLSRPLVL